MFTFASRTLFRTVFAAGLIAAGAALSITASVEPAMALCKYGTPHCVNPHPGPKLPTVGGAQLPPSGWVDPDCKYYGNCNSSEVKGTARRAPTGGQNVVVQTNAHPVRK